MPKTSVISTFLLENGWLIVDVINEFDDDGGNVIINTGGGNDDVDVDGDGDGAGKVDDGEGDDDDDVDGDVDVDDVDGDGVVQSKGAPPTQTTKSLPAG